MVFMLKIFNSVISLRFKNSARGLLWTDKSLWYNFKLFRANYILTLASHLQSADEPPWTAESSKSMQFSQDQARKLHSSSFFCLFFFSVIICNIFSYKEPGDNLWNQQPQKQCGACWGLCIHIDYNLTVPQPEDIWRDVEPTAFQFVCVAISSKLELIDICCYCQQLLFFCYFSSLI